ncbi:MAG: SMP-30/gluconolactonase/LRE family protein [Pseudomonadota bacterium]
MAKVSVLSDHQCHLGEGPFFCERRNALFWFDILGRKRHAYDFSNNQQSVFDLTGMPSAMAVVDDQHDAILTSTGLWLLNTESNAWSPIVNIEADNPITRSNDARVHPSGAFWMGTMGQRAEDKLGAIYHYRKGTLTTLFHDISIPNGICFSPDGGTAYFTDTPTDKLMQVPVDPDTGLPEADPEVVIDHTGKAGGLDGAIVDANGNIWIALWDASAVNCYAPTGQLLESISIPATKCTCPAFVIDGKIAVTSAWQGMNNEAKAADPGAGKTFLLDIKVKPKFEPRLLL